VLGEIFFSKRPDRHWGPHGLLINRYWGSIPETYSGEAWSWPLTSARCRGQEQVELLNLHSFMACRGTNLSLPVLVSFDI